jgi:hypothetical protein
MYYVVVEDTIYEFYSRADAERCYENAESEYREPFMTQYWDVAQLIREGNIAEDYLRGVC